MRPSSRRKYRSNKALPLWIILGAILFIIIVLTIIFTTVLSDFGNTPPELADPGWKAARADFLTKIQNPGYTRRLSIVKREQLVAEGYIPEAWAKGDFSVPWSEARNAAKVKELASQK
jgi:hypothetical protein